MALNTATEIKWTGTEDEQQAARVVFGLLAARGRFFAEDAPIRQSLAALVEYFGSAASPLPEALRARASELVQRSIEANPHVFGVEEGASGPVAVTTRRGTAPRAGDGTEERKHTFRERLNPESRQPTEDELRAVRGVSRDIPEMVFQDADLFATSGPSTLFVPDEVYEPEDEAGAQPVPAPAPVSAVARFRDAEINFSLPAEEIAIEHGELFVAALRDALEQDFRFVRFGSEYYVEDKLERLSKGQLREIKEYINERGQPLTDEEIISDGLRRPLQDADYSLWRFTVNFRLHREKKDFRFVGTADDRLWATTTLPALGEPYRKPAEIAQDYRYLADPELSDDDVLAPARGEEASGRLEIRHVLTWYESENGVLPVGRQMQMLLPKPLMEDQSSIVLRVQDPQNFAVYLAEYRLPSNNRGPYIGGLEELFQSVLVPGGRFALVQGAASNAFTFDYERSVPQESRLLQFDDRKERWFFAPIVYECTADAGSLLTEEKVGKLNGQKRKSDQERKRPELLVQSAFEIVGEKGAGGELTALATDLLPVLNVERPFSLRLLESILDSPQYPQFAVSDESVGLATYAPR